MTSETRAKSRLRPVAINFLDQKSVDGAGRHHDVGFHVAQDVAHRISQAGQSVDLAFHELRGPEQLVETVPELGRAVDGGEESVAQQIVEAAVARIEQVEDFEPRLVRGEVLKGVAQVPRGDVLPLAETGGENKDLFQKPGVAGCATALVNNL